MIVVKTLYELNYIGLGDFGTILLQPLEIGLNPSQYSGFICEIKRMPTALIGNTSTTGTPKVCKNACSKACYRIRNRTYWTQDQVNERTTLTLLGSLWGIEHTSHLTRVVIKTWLHLHVRSNLQLFLRLRLNAMFEACLVWDVTTLPNGWL